MIRKSLKLAVVGCGSWGLNLVRNFHALGVLGAVCDERPDHAASIGRQFDVAALSIDQILNDSSLDAVAVATPAETHAVLALQAMQSGKHVFVEKPLALEPKDAVQMGRVAERTGHVLMVGHLLRYHPGFLALQDLVRAGRLGLLHYISSARRSLGRIRTVEDVVWSFAPHDISMILALAGRRPQAVLAHGTSCLTDRQADFGTVFIRFEGGLDACLDVSWLHPRKEQTLVVVGDLAMAVFDDVQPWSHKLLLYPHRIKWEKGQPEPVRGAPVPVALEPSEPLALECEHFLDCILNGHRPRTDWQEGLEVLRVLDAARRSMTTGAAVPVTLEEAKFFMHPSACIDPECQIGAGTKIWFFSHVLSGSRIGQNCTIGQNVMIGPDVTVGNNCKIQNNVSLYPGVLLADDVFCGPSCVFTNVLNPRASINRKSEFRKTLVGKGATIGANATIICGHQIGRYAFVAAGAVVTRDVPDHCLVAGNPARQIGWISEAGHRLGPDLVCPQTAQRYRPDGRGGLEREPDLMRAAS